MTPAEGEAQPAEAGVQMRRPERGRGAGVHFKLTRVDMV